MNQLKQKIVRTLYHSSLRSFLRKIRILHLSLALIKYILALPYIFQYFFLKNTTLSITINGYKGSFLISSLTEYKRIKSFGSEKKLIRKLLEKIGIGDTVYDIGASIGLYTIFLARVVGDQGLVVAFEPEKQSRERLMQNIAHNKLQNVKIIPLALGNTEETKKLIVDAHFTLGAHTVAYQSKKILPSDNTQDITIVRGDNFIRSSQLPMPRVLKIDVEGLEYDVLQGMIDTIKDERCKIIFCEVHFSMLEKRNIVHGAKKIEILLQESGFTTFEWLDYSHLLAIK